MMNPSANGWIEKYFFEYASKKDLSVLDDLSFYKKIRTSGFIYGHVIFIDSTLEIDISQWKQDEISKLALLNNLYETFCNYKNITDYKQFITHANLFYQSLHSKSFDFKKILNLSTESQKLEGLIDDRVQTNKDIISKNFSHIVTNALLFADVLAFRLFLSKGEISNKYLKRLEEIILSIVTLSLKVKTKKTHHDDLLIKLFESSVRYTTFSVDNEKAKNYILETIEFNDITEDLEKYYLLDLAGLTLWNDQKVENEELYFLDKLSEKFGMSDSFINESVEEVHDFISKYLKDIQYFNYSNPVKHFYDQTTTGVQVLIKRNKKRLIKEISESKELMILLRKSTQNDLSPEEKKKIKKQILDICKSIPSLTIFLLPGGGLLLPILIKFIPQLLPSAFNENLDD